MWLFEIVTGKESIAALIILGAVFFFSIFTRFYGDQFFMDSLFTFAAFYFLWVATNACCRVEQHYYWIPIFFEKLVHPSFGIVLRCISVDAFSKHFWSTMAGTYLFESFVIITHWEKFKAFRSFRTHLLLHHVGVFFLIGTWQLTGHLQDRILADVPCLWVGCIIFQGLHFLFRFSSKTYMEPQSYAVLSFNALFTLTILKNLGQWFGTSLLFKHMIESQSYGYVWICTSLLCLQLFNSRAEYNINKKYWKKIKQAKKTGFGSYDLNDSKTREKEIERLRLQALGFWEIEKLILEEKCPELNSAKRFLDIGCGPGIGYQTHRETFPSLGCSWCGSELTSFGHSC